MVLEAIPSIWSPWATKAREANPDPEREAFIQENGPYAKRYGSMLGIAPEVLLAMKASETNWGAAGSSFGIKGKSPSGNSAMYDTWEAGPNGERIPTRAEFAVYKDKDEEYQHFIQVLNQPNFKPALEHVQQTGDSAGFLRMINDAGYATDRNWANSIVALANGMGNGQFPDPPPPGEGKVLGASIGGHFDQGIGISDGTPNAYQKMARLVVQKRINADEARQAVVDEEARARLETDLSRPMPELAHERTSAITPPSVGDGGVNRISPPGVDASIHPSIMPPGVDASVHPQDPGAVASAALKRFDDSSGFLGLGNTGTLKDAATQDIPVLSKAKDVVGSLAENGVGVGPLANLAGINKAVSSVTGAPNVFGTLNRLGTEGAVPTTPLDVGLTLGPENLIKGLGIAGRALGSGEGAVARIIPKNKRELESAFDQSIRIAKEAKAAYDDALKAGKSIPEARAARDAVKSGVKEEAYNAQRDYRVEQEMQNPYRAGKENKAKTDAMKDAMGPGVVDNAAEEAAKIVESLMGKTGPLTTEERSTLAEALKAAPDSGIRLPESATSDWEPSARDKFLAEAATILKKLGNPAGTIREGIAGGQEGSAAAGKPTPVPASTPVTPATSSIWHPLESLIHQYNATKDAITDPTADRSVFNNIKAIPGVAQGLISSMDVGSILRQLQAGGWRDPKGFLNAAKQTFRAYGDPAVEAAAKTAIDTHDLNGLFAGATRQDRADALADLLYKKGFGVKADLQNVAPGGRSLFMYGGDAAHAVPGREGLDNTVLSKAAKSLGYMQAGDRAYSVGANVQGVQTFEALARPMIDAGVSDLKAYEDIMHVINLQRGHSGTELATALGKTRILFSPQFMFSRPQLVNAMRDGTLSPEARKLARESIVSMAAGQASMLAMLGTTGAVTGLWSVGTGPDDFGTFKVGNTRIDAMAGFGPLVRTTLKIGEKVADGTIGTDMAGDVGAIEDSIRSFLENKAAPIPGILEKGIFHKQWPDPKDWTTYAKLVAPMLAMDIYEGIVNNTGSNKLLAAPIAAISALGGGTNTYKNGADVKRETADSLGLGDYNALDDVQKLKVLAQLPDDAPKNVMQDEKQAFDAAKKQAGYTEPEKAPADRKETRSEIEARDRVNKGIAEKNADIRKSNPDLDVQQWFFGDKTGGAVHSLDAVDKALSLDIQGRKVQYSGAERDLAASADDKKAWQKYGNIIDWYQHGLVDDPKNLDDASGQKYQGRKYADLKATEQDSVKEALRAAANKDPQTEALRIFFGVEKPDKDGNYHASSSAVIEKAQELWKEFPGARPLPQANTKIIVPAKK